MKRTSEPTGSWGKNVFRLTRNIVCGMATVFLGLTANHVRTAIASAIILILVASPARAEDPPPFLLEWGSFGTADGQFQFPAGMDFDSADNIYIANARGRRVDKFDSDGNFILTWGFGVQDGSNVFQICTSSCQAGIEGSDAGQFITPTHIAVDANDNVFVTTPDDARVQKFTSSGAFLTSWTTHHPFPIGIAVNKTTGNVYVSVLANNFFQANRIEKYDNSGAFLFEWGTNCCGLADGQLNRPLGIAVDANGDVYVVDSAPNPRVQKFDSNGNFITKWGSQGTGDGQFASNFGGPPSGPIDIAVDSQGNVYVVDTGNNRIQKFTGSGGFLTKWGSFGSGQVEFNNPFGVAVDSSGNVYVADHQNHRIQKFGFAAGIEKQIASGPDEDGDGEIDVVVEVGQAVTTEYDFDITYTNPGGPDVLIVDTTPAEWQVTDVAGNVVTDGFGSGSDGAGGAVDVAPANKKDNNKSATIIQWTPDPGGGTINVVVTTRESPGKGHKKKGPSKFRPTSCGPLVLNDGALVFELDPLTDEPLRDPDTGEVLPPIFESDPLLLVAVEDVNFDGIIARDGSGDEDGDGLTDLDEVSGEVVTDPCLADTDGDGVDDGLDSDPLDPEVQ